jgi:predicted Zn-dependent peptidase
MTQRGVQVLLLVFVLGVVQSGAQQSKVPRLDFSDQRLDNGLRVLIAPDHSAPVFAIAITYNVGSRNERPGRTGFAHLFEHMMFQGSENVGKGEHFILILNNGGGMNGTTNEDRTNYFEELPKNQLDLALFLEADRMRSLAVNQANVDNQRNAVQEERRIGVDNQPYGKSDLEIENLAYDNFAYKHSTIGSMADLDAASVDDVKDFFRIYYAPNNAVLALVGDLEPQEALEKVKKYFGDIPSQPAPPKVDLAEPEHYGERREVIYDPLARLPQLQIAYHIPRGDTPENFQVQVLANILGGGGFGGGFGGGGGGGGQSSRFYQHLVKQKQLAVSIQVFPTARIGPSLLEIVATPRPGVKPDVLEKAIYEEIEAVQKDGVTAQEIEKARNQYLRSQIQGRQSSMQTAIRLGQYAVFFNDPDLINTSFDKFNAVTEEQVKQAAQKYLAPSERTVVTTLPEKAQARAAVGQ